MADLEPFGGDMRRREFLGVLSGAAASWSPVASAQEAGRTYRVIGLFPSPRDAPQNLAMFEEVRRNGFVEGQNLTIDWRAYGQRIELLTNFQAEFLKGQPDVILAGGDAAIRVAQQATTTIPILGFTDDMVGSKLVTALANHGGNTTGVSLLATELDGKRQDLLIEAVPGLRRMAALADTITTAPQQLQALKEAAAARGIELSIHRVATPGEIAPAVDSAKTSGVDALNVLASPLLFANRQVILERAAARQMPAIYQWPEVAEQGGFIGYGPRIVQLFRDIMGRQLVKLLRGAKPAELPVEQPVQFEFVINLRTAKAIGVEVPAGLVLRADKLIE
jgi:putative ABC transport system substrate-binding protein